MVHRRVSADMLHGWMRRPTPRLLMTAQLTLNLKQKMMYYSQLSIISISSSSRETSNNLFLSRDIRNNIFVEERIWKKIKIKLTILSQ